MISVTTHDAKTHLSRLLKRIEKGEEIIIRRGDNPVAKLVPYKPDGKSRKVSVGTVTSSPVALSDDAFAPLSDKELQKWGL